MTGSSTSDRSWTAVLSLALGLLGLCGWLVPICGLPLPLGAVVLGLLGRGTSRRWMAIAGLALGVLGLVVVLGNAVLFGPLGILGVTPVGPMGPAR